MNKVLVRSISGVVFVAVMLAGLLVNEYLFGLLAGFMLAGILAEFLTISLKGKKDFYVWIAVFGTLYILSSLAEFIHLGFPRGSFDGRLLLCFFIIIWSSDVGAFCVGCTLGKKWNRKMAPTISPNKSWAGFWGGMAFSVIAALILRNFVSLPTLHIVAVAMLMHCAGVCGDLLESKWKRYFGVKDSGKLLPGHGGLLDRFDSSLLAIPVGALYLSIFKFI